VLLEAASVAGREFAVAAVAASLERDVEEVEVRCAALARQRQFVRACGTDEWVDGTIATRYSFLHDLYWETVYARIPAGLRVQWHQRIGARLETGYGTRAPEIAAELAAHFVQGRDIARAMPYVQQAGEQAIQRRALPTLLHSRRARCPGAPLQRRQASARDLLVFLAGSATDTDGAE